MYGNNTTLPPPLCVCQDPSSLYSRFVASSRLPVSLSLVDRFNGSVSGSAKCDAYLWALEHLLQPGLTNTELLAYFVDYYWVSVPMGSGKQVRQSHVHVERMGGGAGPVGCGIYRCVD